MVKEGQIAGQFDELAFDYVVVFHAYFTFVCRNNRAADVGMSHVFFGGEFRVYAVACSCMQKRANTGETSF